MKYLKSLRWNEWGMTVQPDGEVLVQYGSENRFYSLDRPVQKVVHEEQYVYIHTDVNIYQFKFEDNKFLVGDILDFDFEHLEEFAMHVFGEDV